MHSIHNYNAAYCQWGGGPCLTLLWGPLNSSCTPVYIAIAPMLSSIISIQLPDFFGDLPVPCMVFHFPLISWQRVEHTLLYQSIPSSSLIQNTNIHQFTLTYLIWLYRSQSPLMTKRNICQDTNYCSCCIISWNQYAYTNLINENHSCFS